MSEVGARVPRERERGGTAFVTAPSSPPPRASGRVGSCRAHLLDACRYDSLRHAKASGSDLCGVDARLLSCNTIEYRQVDIPLELDPEDERFRHSIDPRCQIIGTFNDEEVYVCAELHAEQ